MVQINTYDHGRAINQGTQNALNTLKARQGVRDVKRQQAISETGKQLGDDYNHEEHANALRKQGYSQAANALTQQGRQARGQEMSNQLDQMKLVAATAPMARDQQSWERVREKWIKFGADPQSIPEEFDPDFVRHMQGKAKEDLSKSDLVEVQGPNGRPVFVRASEAEGMSPAGDGMGAKDKEAMRLMRQGIPENWAYGVADGNVSTETDQFGNITLVHKGTGETRTVKQQGQGGESQPQTQPQGQQPSQQQGSDVYGAVDEGTGPGGNVRQFINRAVGWMGEGSPFPDTAKSRAAIRNFNQTAKQALINSNRFPVYEQKLVQQLLPDPDQFFNDPDAETQKLDQLREFLGEKKRQNQRSMESGNVTRDEYGTLSNQNATIERVLGLMGDPPESNQSQEGGQFTQSSPATPQSQQDYEALPSGAYFRDDEGLKRKP